MKVTALAGGVGGAKLLVGLDRVVPPGDLTAIVNVADDEELYGVLVSPDVDIVTYWLAGLADTDRGWGLAGDTFDVVDALGRLGHDTWFRLGDRDFATCLFRTERLRAGATPSLVAHEIATALGVRARVLPASDDRIRTKVLTADGRTLGFQEYFVKERCAPEVTEVRYDGIDGAKPGPDVLAAVEEAELVIVCPSNPYLSVGPILELPGVRAELREHPRVVAVSPIVGGAALKGPADKLLLALAGESSARAVAKTYEDFCDVFVFDEVDAAEEPAIAELGMEPAVRSTVMKDVAASTALASELLALAATSR